MVNYNLGGAAAGHENTSKPRQGSDGEDPLVGSHCWLKVQDDDEWVLSRVEQHWAGKVHLTRQRAPKGVPLKVELTDAEFAKMPTALDSMLETGDQITGDLVELEDVNEYTMLHTLRERYEQDLIYTAIGPVLVSINPYKAVKTCSPEEIQKMSKMDPDDLPPHIFSLALAAYSGLVDNGEAQSIMISGESGAGKTETTKLCLNALAMASGSSGKMTQKALESGVLLESFGNAKTVYNNNSSRFGKWCAVFFNDSGKMETAQMETYLLEQSRICAPPKGERNYHIFYHILAGATAEERSLLKLADSNADYTYTVGEATSAGIDDKASWLEVKRQLELLGFSPVQQKTLYTLLSAVLALGNVTFSGTGEDKLCTVEPKALEKVAALLQVDTKGLTKVMTTRMVNVSNERITVLLRPDQCKDTRDAISKALYSSLFDHIVERMNASLREGANKMEEGRYIGLLDVFGFENFKMNSFEQLCINFTNERLQQLFMDCLIKREQAEYKREGIMVGHIVYPDNSAQIALIDDKRGGVFAFLDDECNAPKGTDENYVTRMHEAFDRKNPLYSRPKFGANAVGADLGKEMDKLQFVITHYAEQVQYTAYNWLEKNRGKLSPELTSLLASSDNPIVQMAFPEGAAEPDPSLVKKTVTVSGKFRASLRALSATIMQTYQHFVRCMKPNGTKTADDFNGKFTARQMRYLGVHAVVEINRVGYPAKFIMKDFIRRYRCVAFDQPKMLSPELPERAICKNLVNVAGGEKAGEWFKELAVQLGKTKIFMRHYLLAEMERPRRAARGKASISVQKFARRWLACKVTAVVRAHVRALVEVRAVLDKLDDDRSAVAIGKLLIQSKEKLEKLAAVWDACALPVGLAAPLEWRARQLEELEAEQKTLDEGLVAEKLATAQLYKVLAKESSTSKAAFLSLKAAVGEARAIGLGLTDDLREAIKKTEEAIDERFASMLNDWEEEVKRVEAEREAVRLAKCREQERNLTGANAEYELLIVDLRNGVDPKSTTLKALTGFTPTMGVVLNDMNAVEYLKGGGTAMIDGQLRAGDVIVAVGAGVLGEHKLPLEGKKAVDMINQLDLPKVSLTVARPTGVTRADDTELPTGDFNGWVHVVRAKVTFKGMSALHAARKVYAVIQGSTVSLHEEMRTRSDSMVERPLSLKGAVCKAYQKPKGGGKHHLPIVADMYAKGQYPFRLTWPAGEVEFELICATETKEQRAAWVKAVEEAIEATPLKGWLKMRQPPKKGIASKLFTVGWDRRWFDLQQAQGQLDPSLSFYEAPESTTPIGVVVLNKDSELELSSEYANKAMPHVIVVTSKGPEEGAVPVRYYLACENTVELEKWKTALSRALRSFHKHKGPAVKQSNEEKVLMQKSLVQLRLMLEYLGVEFDKKSEDKFKLCFLIVKHRELNIIAKKEGAEDKSELMQKIKKEEARLMQRSVDELRQLLEYMEVELADDLDDKERLVKLIINQKNLPAVANTMAPRLQAWRNRSRSSSADMFAPRSKAAADKPDPYAVPEHLKAIPSDKAPDDGAESEASDTSKRPSQMNTEL